MTNRHLLLLFVFSLLVAWRAGAQNVPQGFSYQCIVRDATGSSVNNQTVTLLFTVRSGAPNGPVAYSEKQVSSTNAYGLVNLTVGQGTPLQGTFSGINWGNGAKYLTVSVETAPNVFDELGSTQLMSVPYALFAQNTNDGKDNWGTQVVQTTPVLGGDGTPSNPLTIAQQGAQNGQVLKWDGTKWTPQNDNQSGGSVTQINTGTGLTGGPITTTGTISLANTTVTPGLYGSPTQIPVITVDQQGRITDVSTVLPQPSTVGITGAAGISVQQNGVNFTITNTGDTNASDDLTTSSQANGDVTGPFSDLQIKAGAVGSTEIADGAVISGKIADGAVVTNKLGDNAVVSSKLADAAVTSPKLGNGAVTEDKIANSAVTAGKLDDMGAASGQVLKWNGNTWVPGTDNVGTVTLTNGAGIAISGTSPNFTITNTGDTNAGDDLTVVSQANGDVTGPFADLQLKSGVVGSPELANNAVTSAKISDGAVGGDKIAQQGAANGQVLKWNGSSWAPAADNVGSVTITGGVGIDVIAVGNNFTIANGGDINPFDDITENSTAGGDISGTFNNLQIKQSVVTNFEMANNAIATANIQNSAVTGAKIAQMSALNGQVLKWNGTSWAPANDDSGSGGDNWGTQVVITNATLTGFGTAGSPLGIAPQGASSGQVLKWSGTAWLPANDNNSGPDNWGSQTATTGATLAGNGTSGSPLNLAQQGATNGQVLKWNGTAWLPANDNNSGGDNWGSQTAATGATLAGNGTSGAPLNLAQQGATNGQVLKWNGTAWLPANDDNNGGDNWGSQTAATGAALTGNGTSGAPLNLAQQGATSGQVLKWNGSAWLPAADGGDNWGSQTAATGAALTGNGTSGTPLNLAQQGATNGQVLKWNGSAWLPANDNTGSGPADNWGTQVAITNSTLQGNGLPGTPLGIAQQGATNGQVLQWNGTTWAPATVSGDNWGTQKVESSLEFDGDGTSAAPLELAGQGATFGQVLKWKGTYWGPGDDDNTGDNWGVQTVEHSTEMIGSGTIASPLALAPQGASAGQVLKWTGTSWAPGNDLGGGNNYAAGTGIIITGVPPNLTINNNGDLSNTNEIQTLSLAGNDLTLSNGGGTVTLPGGGNNYAAGTGISITGSAPNFTINNTGDADANPNNEIQTLSLAGNDLSLSKGGGTVTLPSGNTYTAGTGISITGSAPNFTITNAGDNDNDPSNELQKLLLNGTKLKITGVNSEVYLDTVLASAGFGLWTALGNNIFNANSGNVGVGTNTPASKFHVKSNGEAIRVQGSAPLIGFVDGNGANYGGFIGQSGDYMIMGSQDSSTILLTTAGGKSVIVDGLTGSVGIGGPNKTSALKVYHDAGGFVLENKQSGNNWEFQVSPSGGNLLLYNNVLGGFPAGVFATNGVYTPSDRRLKKDIQSLTPVLDKLKLLNPVSYRYKPESSAAQASIGFIAQDVKASFPELVTENAARDGNTYLGLNYAGMSVIAVKAIQEQQVQIESLKKANSDLQQQVNTMEARLKALEQALSKK